MSQLSDLNALFGQVGIEDRPDTQVCDVANGVEFLVKDTRLLIDDYTLPHVSS